MAPATETLPTASEQIDTLPVTSGDEVLSWSAEQAIPDTQVSALLYYFWALVNMQLFPARYATFYTNDLC